MGPENQNPGRAGRRAGVRDTKAGSAGNFEHNRFDALKQDPTGPAPSTGSPVPMILPRCIAGYAADYMFDPRSGRVHVCIWRTERRDDGFSINCKDWATVGRLIDRIASEAEART